MSPDSPPSWGPHLGLRHRFAQGITCSRRVAGSPTRQPATQKTFLTCLIRPRGTGYVRQADGGRRQTSTVFEDHCQSLQPAPAVMAAIAVSFLYRQRFDRLRTVKRAPIEHSRPSFKPGRSPAQPAQPLGGGDQHPRGKRTWLRSSTSCAGKEQPRGYACGPGRP